MINRFLKAFLVAYVFISFIVLDLNFFNWDIKVRGLIILVSCILTDVISVNNFVDELKKELKKTK